MNKKKQTIKINVGDILSFEQVFDAELEILSQEDLNKRKEEIEKKHKEFLNEEEWRKYIKWKPAKSEIVAVKIEDDKYKVSEINHYTNTLAAILHYQENLDALFQHHPLLNKFKFDDYSKTKEFNGEKYNEDVTPSLIFNLFRRTFDGWCPTTEIKDTITETIDNNKYNFLTDYFDSLVWDGVERLDNFLIDYYGAEDNPLVKAYFSRWIIAMVKRSYIPGAKFDSMLILASSLHGKKKTSLGEWLGTINGRKLYNDAPDDLRNLSEVVYATKGKAILMFDDFDDICDKGQLGKVKSFITQRARTAALKWQHDKDYPITYVLFGTTNRISILVDDATFDERRFWVVEVNPKTDIFDLGDDLKDQLYAEAVYRYKQDPNQFLWLWEPELRKMEIEWQKKYKKANEDTMTEKVINIFNKKYPIKNGMFKSESEFRYYVMNYERIMDENEHINEPDPSKEFFGGDINDKNEIEYIEPQYIKIIPSAWIIKYLESSTRGTDRIIQILHTQGYDVEKKQRYNIYDMQLTVIQINKYPSHLNE